MTTTHNSANKAPHCPDNAASAPPARSAPVPHAVTPRNHCPLRTRDAKSRRPVQPLRSFRRPCEQTAVVQSGLSVKCRQPPAFQPPCDRGSMHPVEDGFAQCGPWKCIDNNWRGAGQIAGRQANPSRRAHWQCHCATVRQGAVNCWNLDLGVFQRRQQARSLSSVAG